MTPRKPIQKPTTPPSDDVPDDASPKATPPNNLQAAILNFCVQYDVAAPLDYFDALISRSGAFRARADGQLDLKEVRSRAAVKPSELARYLNNAPRTDPAQN